MKWLKGFILSSLFFILLPAVLSEIEIKVPDKAAYNLGEKIGVSVSILEIESHEGFMKIMIECGEYNLQYYTTPLQSEANFRTQLEVPELPLFASMVGECKIKADFENSLGEIVSQGESKAFTVSDQLIILTSNDVLAMKPDKDFLLLGSVKYTDGRDVEDLDVKISFDEQEFETQTKFGNFEQNFDLDLEMDVRDYSIKIFAEDGYKNHGQLDMELSVLPIPTRIENQFMDTEIKPGTALKAKIILRDHKDDPMDGVMKVGLYDPDGKEIISKNVESHDLINYEFSQHASPGTYTIISEMNHLKTEDNFEVQVVREVSMTYNGGVVTVKNVGNVNYEDETTIVIESEKKKYLVNEEINLKPGETMEIDLSKEVPAGNYNVILSEDEGEEKVIEGVPITDNRPLYKKLFSGIAAITGAVAGTAGLIASRPLLATLILIVIVASIILYYSRRYLAGKTSSGDLDDSEKQAKQEDPEKQEDPDKTSDQTGDLFKDYKFDEEKKD